MVSLSLRNDRLRAVEELLTSGEGHFSFVFEKCIISSEVIITVAIRSQLHSNTLAMMHLRAAVIVSVILPCEQQFHLFRFDSVFALSSRMIISLPSAIQRLEQHARRTSD